MDKSVEPPKEKMQKMMSLAFGIALKTVLRNHIFTFFAKCWRQKNGGAIGVRVAGDVANVFMIWWDRQIKRQLELNKITLKLYSRYVDDGHVVLKAVPTSESEDREEKTMNLIKDIANKIHPTIQVKVDYPSNNENGRMPVLDTEQWIESVSVEGQIKPQILHSHYMKPMSNKHVIHKDSAISDKAKINILTADLVRIMRNVSPLCKEEERGRKVQQFINRMQYSGYNKSERVMVYKKAKGRYQRMISNDKNKVCPLYRSKFWRQKERMLDKGEQKTKWCQNEKYTTTFFVEATKNKELARECQRILDDASLGIKVIEKTGESIKSKLVKSDPFKKKSCGRETCLLCSSGRNINCKSREITYEICCNSYFDETNKCDGKYDGETSRSSGERLGEHLDLYHKRNEKSIFHKHMIEAHKGERKELTMKITGRYPGDPMLRQVSEALIIKQGKSALNSKEEWGNMNISRKRKKENQASSSAGTSTTATTTTTTTTTTTSTNTNDSSVT